jgi:hypothetical protein
MVVGMAAVISMLADLNWKYARVWRFGAGIYGISPLITEQGCMT